VFEHLH
jgi:protein kinase A